MCVTEKDVSGGSSMVREKVGPRRTSEVDIKETRRITALTREKWISGTSDRSEGRTRDRGRMNLGQGGASFDLALKVMVDLHRHTVRTLGLQSEATTSQFYRSNAGCGSNGWSNDAFAMPKP